MTIQLLFTALFVILNAVKNPAQYDARSFAALRMTSR